MKQQERTTVQKTMATTVPTPALEDGKLRPATPRFSPRFMSAFADEVAKLVIARLPKRQAPSKPKTVLKKDAVGSVFLDTSAIIDKRILDILLLGFGPKVVTLCEGVLHELKHIADGNDALRKPRAKAALEMLSRVKKQRDTLIVYVDDKTISAKEVDEQLILLAKKYRARILTGDANLEKKAQVMGVKVVNVHALADAFKIHMVPGELIDLKIVHVGKEAHQGVGYLDDGTMIVVEHASDQVGNLLSVAVSRVIQTVTGRILFAKIRPNELSKG